MEKLGITIEFQGKELNFDRTVANMNKSINLLKKEVRLFNKELKVDPKNLDILTKKMNNLRQQEQLAKDMLQEYRDYLEDLNAKGVSPFNEEWKETVVNIEKSEEKLLGIQQQIGKLGAEMDKLPNKWELFSEMAGKASEAVGKVADTIEPLSKGSWDFLKTASEGAIEFEDAFADVEKTVNTSEAGFTQIRQDLRDMALTLPTSASDLAHIAGLAGQMNVPAEQVAEFTRSMVDFGNATDITAEQATQDIAQIYNVIGKGGDFSDLDNLLSAIVELGNNSATTESKIVEMFRNISAGASRVGQTEAQMVALSATLSSLGLDKGGASAISKIMTRIDMAVTKGGEDLSAWAEIAGMSGKEFQQAWSQDSANVLLDIVTAMSTMSDEGISMNQILSDLDISEIRQVDTISRLANAHEEYAKNIKLANNAYKSGTALSTEAQKRYQTVASQLLILKNNLLEFALSIGDLLLPYIQQLIQLIGDVATWLNNLSPHTKELIARIALVLAVVTPLLRLLQGGLTLLSNLSTILTVIKTVISLLGGGIVDLVTKIATLIFTHQTLFTVIGIVVGAFILLYNKCDWFKELVDKLIKKVKDLWEKFKQTNWIEALGEKFGWLGEIVGGFIELVKRVIGWFGRLIEIAGQFLGISGSVNSAVGNLGGQLRSSGVIQMTKSGGFSSGGAITLNANFSVYSNSVTREDVHSWSKWIADDINEELGRRI